MKMLDVFSTASSNMMRSKVRTILTIIAIFIGAFTITLTIGISSGISKYIDEQVSSVGAEDVLIVQKKVTIANDGGPQKYNPDQSAASARNAFLEAMLSDKDIETIKQQDGISDVKRAYSVSPQYIVGANGQKYSLSLQPAIDSMHFEYTAGSLPRNDTDSPQILLTNDYVSALGYDNAADATNKQVKVSAKTPLGELREITATVTGVQEDSILSRGGLTANDALIKALYSVQTEGLPSDNSAKYMAAYARFDQTGGSEKLSKIKNELDAKGYTANTVEDQIGVIKDVINAITAVLVFFGAIALLAASFGIINTLFMSVQERTKEIGLMKAMGMSRIKVFILFSVEAIMLGFWGSFIGAALAIGAGQLINRFASDSFLKDLPGFDLTVFPVLPVVAVMVIIMLIAFLAGTLPARRAAKQDPIQALRYE